MTIVRVRILFLIGLFTLALAPLGHAEGTLQSLSEKPGLEILYFEPLPPMSFSEYVSEQSQSESDTPSPSWEWSMDAFGKHFHFHLKPNNRLFAKLPKRQREKIAEKYELFRGKIEGNDESWIRLTKMGRQWSGMIWDGQELYIIDSMKVMAPSLRTIPLHEQVEQGIYRFSDTRRSEETACGVEGSDGVPNEPLSDFQALSEELEETFSASAVGATFNIDVAIVTDPLFAEIQQNNFGTATDAAVIARLNVVDGIYSEQVGVQLNLVEILELSDNGPLTATDSATLLSQFGNFTNSPSFTHPGVAHLFTGRNMDGNTIGRAYVGALCSDRFGVGINEIRQGGTIGAILFAHELGHNFGAPHDNQSGSACASTPGNFIMNPIINNSEEFSQCSLQRIQPEVDSASCITVIDSTNTDIRILLPSSPIEAPINSPFDYEIDIENTGTIAATNVNATVTVSGELTILSAGIGTGTCSIIGTTQANCDLGNIPDGEDRILTLSLQGQNAGQAIIDAEVTADNDQSVLNNTAQGIVNLTNTNPIVTIVSPPNGAILSASNPISLIGEASDPEDGDITGQLEWTSDLDGPIGNGGNLSTTLRIGTHQITAMVEDTDNGQASQVIVITIADGLDGPILFESHFEGGTDGFGYIDDAFRNTSEPTFADGTHEPDQGFSGGGLRVTLGGINEEVIRDMSGGWSRSFTLDTAGEVTVSLRYKLSQASDYESDELSQALLAMDGTLFGTESHDYLAQLAGDGNGGNAQTTDWVPVVVNFGTLTTGPHTLVVGAFNNKKTWPNESTEVLIDDLVVHHTASGPPPQSNSPTVSITSPTDGDSFSDGTIITFAGQASDTEDGNLTTNLAWSSNIDGTIGTGGNFSTSLSLGTHTITAQVSDSSGLSTSRNITIGVVPTPLPPMGTLLIDDFADGNFAGWTVVDQGTSSGPSSWSAATGVLQQTSNIHNGTSNGLPLVGTHLRYDQGFSWTDYQLSLTLRSDDDDALGVMVRYQDPDNYYRFSWDRERSYRRLVKVHNGVFTLLAEDSVPYVQGQTYQVAFLTEGAQLEVQIDGAPIFNVADTSLTAGTVALYTWANIGARFDDVQVTQGADPPPPPSGTPALTTPTPGSSLAGDSATFAWTANGAPVTEWWLYVGTSLGANDLHDSGSLGTQLSTTVTALPTDGSTLFVRLFFKISGTWLQADYQFTSATPALTTPTPGSSLAGDSATFAWTANGAPVTEWWLYVGTSLGANDLHDSGSLGTQLSTTVTALPTDGSTLFVRLFFKISGTWRQADYQFTSPTPALTTPTPGSSLAGDSATFAWTANGAPVTEWWLYVGTSLGANDLHDSGSLGTQLSTTVTALPTDGSTLFVRLFFKISGTWRQADYQFTSPTPALTTPTPGSSLAGDSATFAWAANGAPVTEWWLYVGTSEGANDLHDSGSLGTQLSTTVTALPTDGSTLFVRLFFKISGSWQEADYQFTATTPALTTPTLGSSLAGDSATFAWAANGAPVTEWWLYVGTSLGANDLHDSGSLGTQLSTTVTALPTDGSTLFVRLFFKISGTWVQADYQFTSASPALTTPTLGSSLAGDSATFAWAANGAPVTEWWLYVGTSEGANDLHDSGSLGTQLSTTVTALSTDGSTLFVRLFFKISGTWRQADYQFTSASSSGTLLTDNFADGNFAG